jgi:MFS transporter, DHA3 family, tetracycline resistance protein
LLQPNAFRAYVLYAWIRALVFGLAWTALPIYFVQTVGMTPLQLVLAGTTLEVSAFLFEIPTGIVADLYSRRLSVLIGIVIVGIGFLFMAIPQFIGAIIGHFFWGLGFTFTSGAHNAWLVDEIGQEAADKAFFRAAQADKIGGIIGIVGSILLGSIALVLPIVTGASLLILSAIVLAILMPETGFHPTPRQERSTWGKMFSVFREGVQVTRSQPIMLSIIGVGFFYGMFSEGWDRLWQAHLLTTFGIESAIGLPAIVIFGGLNILTTFLSIGSTEWLLRRTDTKTPRKVTGALFAFSVILTGGIFLFGIAPSLIIALIAFLMFTQARSLIDVLWAIWTNQNIPQDSTIRATLLSMQSQTDAIGQIAGGIPVGLIGNLSLRLAFMASTSMLIPTLVIYRRVLQRQSTASRTSVAE